MAARRLRNIPTGYMATLPGALLRPALTIPCGIYVNYAFNHWKVIKKHHELQGGLYSPIIATGEKSAATWGTVAFAWGYAAWLPSVFILPPVSIVFGVVDAIIATFIVITTHYQTGYTPHSISHCKGSGAHDFQLPPGANESFFDAAARLNATVTTPFKMCKSFVVEWQYGIAISVLYLLLALLNLGLSSYVTKIIWQRAKREDRTFNQVLVDSCGNVVPFLVGCCKFFYMIPVILFRCLPTPVKARVRFARRYGVKVGQGLEEKSELQLKTLKRRMTMSSRKGRYASEGPGEPVSLAEFLSIYDVLILVTQHLHFSDVVNLGLVSKSVREAVLPADAYAQRMTHFKMYTCNSQPKKKCWVCSKQICGSGFTYSRPLIPDGCQWHYRLKQTTLYYHLDQCGVYCTSCYFSTVHGQGRSPNSYVSVDPRTCTCAPVTPKPNIFQRMLHSPNHYSHAQLSLPVICRAVCRACDSLSEDQLLEKRKKRTLWELKNGTRSSDQKCTECQKDLGAGPRWWVCASCKKECTSTVHSAWGKVGKGRGKGKKRKHGEETGEEAV